MEQIKVLDHGYVRFVEAWGHGYAGIDRTVTQEDVGKNYADLMNNVDMECGKIEAARQSTQGSFRGWEDKPCSICSKPIVLEHIPANKLTEADKALEPTIAIPYECKVCNGTKIERGDARLLSYLFTNKPQHATPFEFAGMVIEVQAPIFVFREWHRHRTASYNEMSARYAPLPDLNYIPTVERLLRNSKKNKQAGVINGASPLDETGAKLFQTVIQQRYRECENSYQNALEHGVPKELARIVLPVGRYSRMRASTNLRNWLGFVTLRSDENAMWEIQEFSRAVESIIKEKFPRTYDLFLKRRGS